MSFFKRKKAAGPTVWPELTTTEHEPLPPELLATLLGKNSSVEPLAAPELLAAYGWPLLRHELLPLLRGERPYVAAVMTATLAQCGSAAEHELTACLNQLTPKSVLAVTCAFPEADGAPLARVLPRLDEEDLDSAFRRLAAGGLTAPVCAYLQHDDWRLVLRAASALIETGRTETREAVAAARDRSQGLAAAALTELLEGTEA